MTGASIDFTLGVGSCDKDIKGLVWEAADIVVIGGTVTPPAGDVACDAALRLAPVMVSLKAPVGTRPIVDAASGVPR